MHLKISFRHWIHQAHDEGIRIAHCTEHLLHERKLWEFIGILVAIAAVLILLILLGNQTNLDYRFVPYPV